MCVRVCDSDGDGDGADHSGGQLFHVILEVLRSIIESPEHIDALLVLVLQRNGYGGTE
jgi:restriction endonuclease Mrr